MREADDKEKEQTWREQLRQISAPRSACKLPLDFWSVVVLRITLVEMLWPPLLQLFLLLEETPGLTIFALGLQELSLSFFVAFLFGTLSCGLLFLFLFVGVEMFARMVLKTLQIRSEQLWVAVFVGGLSGLSISLPFCLLSQVASLVLCCFAISTATILGQLGGAWGARRWLANPDRCTQSKLSTSPIFQFRTRQLFILTVWCALVLTVFSLFNLFSARLFVVALTWAVFQVIGFVVTEVMRRLGRP